MPSTPPPLVTWRTSSRPRRAPPARRGARARVRGAIAPPGLVRRSPSRPALASQLPLRLAPPASAGRVRRVGVGPRLRPRVLARRRAHGRVLERPRGPVRVRRLGERDHEPADADRARRDVLDQVDDEMARRERPGGSHRRGGKRDVGRPGVLPPRQVPPRRREARPRRARRRLPDERRGAGPSPRGRPLHRRRRRVHRGGRKNRRRGRERHQGHRQARGRDEPGRREQARERGREDHAPDREGAPLRREARGLEPGDDGARRDRVRAEKPKVRRVPPVDALRRPRARKEGVPGGRRGRSFAPGRSIRCFSRRGPPERRRNRRGERRRWRPRSSRRRGGDGKNRRAGRTLG